MKRYIKMSLVLLLIFFSYCTFIWHYPKVGENIDFMFNTNFNERLGIQLEIYEVKLKEFGEKVRNWIDNPAPNTSSNIEGRLEGPRNTQ